MSEEFDDAAEGRLVDHAARERFRTEWGRNFAVSANAGSGKTTAISQRLAAMALTTDGAALLKKTAVVTFTKKAAAQIGQRARAVLLQRLAASGGKNLAPLDELERAFFGTIHSFCLKLAQTYGQTLGINLNPTVVTDEEAEALWEEFLEQDPMQFSVLAPSLLGAFLRHVPLAAVFELARDLEVDTARRFLQKNPGPPVGPDVRVLEEILAALPKQKRSLDAVKANQELAANWLRRYRDERSYLPLVKPQGTAAGMPDLFARFFAPLKAWLAEAAALLAAELAGRYRAWRFERGVQTYADQIDAAMAVLHDSDTLERIRAEGWRVILDEAQDTDPQQFAVLVEIARPPGAPLGAWPGIAGAKPPRAGHFCLVGDGQQSIFGSRADIANFTRHVEAYRRGDGGELLHFPVTFRAPEQVIVLLNASLPAAFGRDRAHNLGLPPAEDAPAPLLQVPYVPLVAGPENVAGVVRRLSLELPVPPPAGVDAWQEEEVRQLAAFLRTHGPGAVGARHWGEVAVLAPRNQWLLVAQKSLEAAGFKVALQMRRNRNGDNPAYAWITGLLAALCDPDNTFEWVGVLREVFAVSDALLAAELREKGAFSWSEPESHAEPLRGAFAALRPFVLRLNDDGMALERFATELAAAGALAAKARALDPSGGVAGELERLLAQAAELGLNGGGPRDWLRLLLAQIDAGRPAGKPTDDAINLLTSHSAKGLEWPVVIPLGFWRGLPQLAETGLRIVTDRMLGPRIFFDGESLPDETRESRKRERQRELARLLYVTLTRPRRALLLPWAEGFGGKPRGETLAGLWGASLETIPSLEGVIPVLDLSPVRSSGALPGADRVRARPAPTGKPAFAAWPARLLPHQLAHQPDLVRAARHESGLDEPPPARPGEDPLDYGRWWHETMEFLPWTAGDAEVNAYGQRALTGAEALGFAVRAKEEWMQFRASAAWTELRASRWTRLAELGIFAPLRADAWIDGVIDLVLHDPTAAALWIVDWKTNRRRGTEGNDALLQRLVQEYAPQLQAYGACAAEFFADSAVRLLVFSTAAGCWHEVSAT